MVIGIVPDHLFLFSGRGSLWPRPKFEISNRFDIERNYTITKHLEKYGLTELSFPGAAVDNDHV